MALWIHCMLLTPLALAFLGTGIQKIKCAGSNFHWKTTTTSDEERLRFEKAGEKEFMWGFICVYVSVCIFVILLYLIGRALFTRRQPKDRSDISREESLVEQPKERTQFNDVSSRSEEITEQPKDLTHFTADSSSSEDNTEVVAYLISVRRGSVQNTGQPKGSPDKVHSTAVSHSSEENTEQQPKGEPERHTNSSVGEENTEEQKSRPYISNQENTEEQTQQSDFEDSLYASCTSFP